MPQNNAGKSTDVDKANKKFKQKGLEFKIILKTVLDTYEGRTVLWEFLSRCDLYKGGYTGDNSAYFYEGRRDIGLSILQDIMDIDKNYYTTMMNEADRRAEANG